MKSVQLKYIRWKNTIWPVRFNISRWNSFECVTYNKLYSVFLQGLQANIIQQFEENAIIHQQQQQQNQNQDSSDRSRSSSFNEAAYRK